MRRTSLAPFVTAFLIVESVSTQRRRFADLSICNMSYHSIKIHVFVEALIRVLAAVDTEVLEDSCAAMKILERLARTNDVQAEKICLAHALQVRLLVICYEIIHFRLHNCCCTCSADEATDSPLQA